MTQYLLRKQQEEMWEVDKEERKQAYAKSIKGLLHTKKRVKEPETRMDRLKKMRFTIRNENGKPIRGCEDISILDIVNRCSRRGIDRLYDCVYACYISGTITPLQWSAFENLAERREFTDDSV